MNDEEMTRAKEDELLLRVVQDRLHQHGAKEATSGTGMIEAPQSTVVVHVDCDALALEAKVHKTAHGVKSETSKIATDTPKSKNEKGREPDGPLQMNLWDETQEVQVGAFAVGGIGVDVEESLPRELEATSALEGGLNSDEGLAVASKVKSLDLPLATPKPPQENSKRTCAIRRRCTWRNFFILIFLIGFGMILAALNYKCVTRDKDAYDSNTTSFTNGTNVNGTMYDFDGSSSSFGNITQAPTLSPTML